MRRLAIPARGIERLAIGRGADRLAVHAGAYRAAVCRAIIAIGIDPRADGGRGLGRARSSLRGRGRRRCWRRVRGDRHPRLFWQIERVWPVRHGRYIDRRSGAVRRGFGRLFGLRFGGLAVIAGGEFGHRLLAVLAARDAETEGQQQQHQQRLDPQRDGKAQQLAPAHAAQHRREAARGFVRQSCRIVGECHCGLVCAGGGDNRPCAVPYPVISR